ncbi:unnamed protein product, partial [Mesorhabditis spiculigera]
MRVFCDLLVLGLLQGFLALLYGGYLASISNVFDNTKVLQLARTQFENLGGVDGFWLGGTYDGKAIIWDDGTNATYANLAAASDSGNLVMSMQNGKWNTAAWKDKYPTMCIGKKSNGPQVAPCETEWMYATATKSCYKLVYNIDFANAEEQCRALGATISSVTSNEENDVIIDFAKTGYPGDTIFSAMIGAKRIGPNATDFAWLDGSPFTFYPWANGEPNNVGGRENCIMIWTDEIVGKNTPYRPYLHMWNDVDCDAHRRVAVCKKAALY